MTCYQGSALKLSVSIFCAYLKINIEFDAAGGNSVAPARSQAGNNFKNWRSGVLKKEKEKKSAQFVN